jgi:transcription elongation factor GreA
VDPEENGALEIGERVAVRDLATQEVSRYRIVGTGEADPWNGNLSHESPIGAALLGGCAGDVVEIDIPSGTLRLQVVDVDG